MTKRKVLWAVVVVVTLIVGGIAGAFGLKAYKAQAASDQQCQSFIAEVAGLPAPKGGNLVILGDSYTAGFGLPDASKGYAFALHPSGIDAFPGSGFVDESPCGDRSYARRLLTLTPSQGILVIQGGLNDSDEQGVEAAATQALRLAKMKATRVVLVGPPTVPSKTHQELEAVDSAYSKAADAAGVQYVSALGWDVEVSGDGLHLTEAGHRQFAALLAPEIGLPL